jgi:hypothetical protein
VQVVEPAALADYFEVLTGIYEPDRDGKLIVEWLREDWGLFDNPEMDDPRARALLADILDDGNITVRRYSPSPRFQSDGLRQWEQLRDELMHKNRYFPETEIDFKRLASLLSQLQETQMPRLWFRARMNVSEAAIPLEDMGPPPKRSTTHGRANPAGIPYLYLASTADTAISEIRPHTGEIASVAEFEIAEGLQIADLRNPRKKLSPFLLEEDEIGPMRAEIPFLERLGAELTRPILPQGAAIDYVPSQYLCEFIKKCGFDGVLYRSSVGDGINLALFFPAKARGLDVRQFRVQRVTVAIQDV